MRPKASGIDDSNGKGERREEKSSAEGMEGLGWRGFQVIFTYKTGQSG